MVTHQEAQREGRPQIKEIGQDHAVSGTGLILLLEIAGEVTDTPSQTQGKKAAISEKVDISFFFRRLDQKLSGDYYDIMVILGMNF